MREAELVKRIIIVSLNTGMRRGEILNIVATGRALEMMFGTIGEPRSPITLQPNPDIIIPEARAEKFGYKKLTPEIKAKVFGLNAVKLYKIGVEAARKAIQREKISEMREEYLQSPRPSNTQFGWVWREDSMRG